MLQAPMSLPKLSVNINKYALLRNSRGHDTPNLLWAVDVCLAAGAHGITVHPRADQRHIRFDDVPVIAEHLRARYPGIEYNVECEPSEALLSLVERVRPDQCTLVPVRPGELTSDHGFRADDVERLKPCVERLHKQGIRVSLFVDCVPEQVRALSATGADRVELYTGPYAWAYGKPEQAQRTQEVFDSAEAARQAGLGLNAGHDLDRFNLEPLRGLPGLLEVSIGHAQICRALEVGTRQSVQELLRALGHELPPSA
jgi:pyridoxine 5-phosphate synthase